MIKLNANSVGSKLAAVIVNDLRRKLHVVMADYGQALEDTAKGFLSMNKVVYAPGVGARRSRPGEYPYYDTGELHDNTGHEVFDDADGVTLRFGSDRPSTPWVPDWLIGTGRLDWVMDAYQQVLEPDLPDTFIQKVENA